MKKYKNKIIAGAAIVIVLAVACFWGAELPVLNGAELGTVGNANISETQNNASDLLSSEISAEEANKADIAPAADDEKTSADEANPGSSDTAASSAENKTASAEKQNGDIIYSEKHEINNTEGKYKTEPVPEGRPAPIEPENTVISDKSLTCTLSVRCDAILENISQLDAEKTELVPENGVIYAEREVTFYEGESVFNLLVREMKRNKIHLEFENTPVYNSAYIEGIGNLYEFDCGELSGWMYRVNGWFPNYGCSRYSLKEGDRVEWIYTCDLGRDIGGSYSARNGR